MRDYELVMIISPEVAEEELSSTIEKVTQFIAAKGGAVTAVDQWGRRRLAYPIKRFSEGNYVLAQFKLEQQATPELEASLKLNEEVLRHLLIRLSD